MRGQIWESFCAAIENVVDYYQQMPQLSDRSQGSSRKRRRGEELERALYEATLAVLAEDGYMGLTMDRVAARARTGKAALYKRWCNKRDLVYAALIFALPPLSKPRVASRLDSSC